MSSTKTARARKLPKNGSAESTNGSSPRKKITRKQPSKKRAIPPYVSFSKNFGQEISILKAMLEHTKDALVLFDKEGKVLTFNRAAAELYKKHNKTILKEGESVFTLVSSDRHEPTKEIFANVLGGEPYERIAKSILKGKEYFFKRFFNPVYGADGTVYAVANTITDITGEVEAREKIQEAEAKLRTIIESTTDGFALYDREGRILAFNHITRTLYKKINGTDIGVGKSVYDLIPKDRHTFTREIFGKVLRGETFDLKVNREDIGGSELWLKSSYYPVISESGEVIGITIKTADITEDVRSEQALRESEANLRALFDNAKDGFVLLDPKAIILAFNYAAEMLYQKMFGKTLIIGKSAGEVLGPQIGGYVRAAFEKVLQGESIERKSKQLATDGKEYWLRGYYNPVISTEKKIIGICMGITDITAEMEAQKSVSELAAIIRFSDDAIYSTSLESIVTSWNQGAEKMFGYSADSIIGKPVAIIFPEEVRPEEPMVLSRIEAGESFNFFTKRLTHDGSVIEISLSVSPIRNPEGEIVGVSRIARNVSEQKKLETQLRESREGLEQKVARRTTELQKKNDELQRQKEFSEQMIDSSVDLIAVYDKDLRFVMMNKVSEDFMRRVKPEFKKEDMIGKTFDELNPGPENAESRNDLLESLSGKSIRKAYYRSLPQTMGRDYEVFYEPLRHKDEIYGSLIIIHDITETMNIAEELRRKNIELAESEERYHQMVEDVKDYAIILLDKNGIIQNWNTGAEKLKGYTQAEVVGKHFRLFYLKEDQEKHIPEHLLEEATQNGRSYFEGWRTRKDGSLFWASATLTALHDEKGNIIGFSKVTRDLSERKFAEDTLRNSANQLHEKNEELELQNEYIETLIDSSPDLITVYDKNMRVMTINKEVEKTIGHKRKDIIGKTYLELFPGTKASHTYNNLQRTLKGESTHHVLHDAAVYDHSFDIYMVPLKRHGETYAALVLVHDITELMSISEKLHETNRTIEEKNMELERTNKELEQFAYIASHDLQEPLRKIRTFSGRIQDKNKTTLDDATQEYLQKIVRSSDRMSELIKDILNYSRLNTANVQFEKVDLNTTLKNVLSDFELQIEEKKGKVNASSLPVLEAVPLYMQQLFLNLINNGLKFTRESIPPEIMITASPVTLDSFETKHGVSLAPGKYWEIIFKDNGIGFSPEFSEKIFVIFQRLNERSKYEGTGVGLALCRKITDIHHGLIYAQSKEGEGAEFHVILPEKQG